MTSAPTANPSGRLSLATILAFACTSLPLSALGIALSVYLPRYFASHIGVELAIVGAVFATVRMIDIPLDPALGMIMDRTRTRWGRYRLWTVIGTPILMLALLMLFQAPEGSGRLYLGGWLLVMYLGTSILGLSHSAWAATLATNYHERSRIFGVMTAVGVLGSVLVLAIPILLEQRGMTEAQSVQAMGWFVIALTPIAVLLVVARTPERITKDVHTGHFTLREYWALISRPNMIRILAADLCLSLGPGWMAALYLFYFKDARGFSTTEANILLAVYILAGFAGAPAIGWLAARISKHRAVMVATTGYSLMLMMVGFLPKGAMGLALPAMFAAGFLAAGFGVMTRAITADIGDEVRLEGGKERIGLIYALTVLTSKVAGAFSIFLTFTVLARVGYNAKEGAVNSAQAIHNLELAYLIGPIVFVMLGGACFIGYKLDAKNHAEVRRQLDERDALYDEAPIIASVTAEPGNVVVEPRT
ncbi:MFS transporter [Phenylobacterium sp. 20VBR1]|uniref:MFS transporter n=1 Tax=Phenylobacterium glaciei TaxID=2803784 RepID=A0A941HUS1_9CAUL|nr:MFS transporter [Phenylobacterium glaciei]MBR7618964.1 MFS transporter [Phenylobacterium glaciei]